MAGELQLKDNCNIGDMFRWTKSDAGEVDPDLPTSPIAAGL
jgi:hypothetical protein